MAKEEKAKAQEQKEQQEQTIDMEALKAEMQEELKAQLMAELKAEMQAELKAEQESKGKVKSTPMTKEEIEYWDEPVEYSAPYIEEAEDEIVVGHNGKLYKIKRGETVMIPRKVRQVLLDSEKQKMEFAKLRKGLENQELQA